MPSEPELSHRESRAARIGWPIAVLLVTAATFARSLSNEFVAWDDDVNFLLNPHVRGLTAENLRWMWSSFHAGHFMPLTWMSCALDYEIAGFDPRAFHATNVALHAVTAWLLYLALAELLALIGARGSVRAASAIGALFFAVHPLRVESVAWATERRDVLSGALFALTIWAWLRAQRPDAIRGRWLALSLAAFAASLLSKVSGMTLPLVLLALAAWPLRRLERVGWRPLLREIAPYAVLALAGACIGLLGQRYGTDVLAGLDARPLADRISIAAFALRSYLRHTLLPLDLSAFYELPHAFDPFAARYLFSIAFVVITTWFLASRRKRSALQRTAWTAWIVFGLLLAPVSGLVQAGEQITADRYTYLPSFALAGAVAALFLRVQSGRAALPIAFAALAALAAAAWKQCGYWHDTERLFERVVEVEPGSYTGHHKLGVLAHQRGEFAAAIEHYDRCLAARPDRRHTSALYDRALSKLALGERGSAFADLHAALRDQPAHADAWYVLGREMLMEQRGDEALAKLQTVIDELGEREGLLASQARLLLAAGRNEEALGVARRMSRLAPSSPLGARLQGTAELYLGRFLEAEASFRRARALAGPNVADLYPLGLALSRQGRDSEARETWERVLELEPSHPGAREKLGR
jgi:tetratricopeptide (TPR) repeat protein